MRKTANYALILGLLLFFPTLSQPVTIHIPDDQMTIQAGIDAASEGDTVLVADGTYTGEGNRDIDFGGKNIIVRSENGPEVTIIDCQGSASEHHRGFNFHNGEDSTAVVAGFTITGGYVSSYGGAIICTDGSNPTIANNMIITNQALNGGGGIGCTSSGPIITGNYLSGNTGDDGGAVMLSNSNATISYNIAAKNYVPYEGGAFSFWNSSPVMESNTIVGNTAGFVGSAMFLYDSSPTLDKCVVAFNHGGNTIACHASGTNDDPYLSCTNVFGNNGGDWVGCIAEQADSNGNFSLNPLFCDTSTGDYNLLSASPCAPSNNSCNELIGALGLGCDYLCGDANDDETINILDITYLIACLYQSGLCPEPQEKADVNSDGAVNILDITYLIAFLYQGGPEPDCP
jgi:hypothetical protein